MIFPAAFNVMKTTSTVEATDRI